MVVVRLARARTHEVYGYGKCNGDIITVISQLHEFAAMLWRVIVSNPNAPVNNTDGRPGQYVLNTATST